MTIRHTKHTGFRRWPRERGAAMVLIVIAMLALIMMAGLALDVGHMMVNKTRLQNAVDAAALSAAKTLDETSSTSLATAAALQALGLDANDSGNQELATSYNGGTLQVTVQYSSTLPPFTPGAAAGPYVRVIAEGFAFPTWLADVGGIMQLHVSADAVAGPSPTINTACNIAPMLACGLPPSQGGSLANLWGYQVNAPQVLKSSAPGSAAVGPGNFQLIQLGGSGGDIVRSNMAGDYQSCQVSGNSVQTETGNETGPVAQGLNTRFGIYTGPATMTQYPPDVITTTTAAPTLTVDSSDNVWWGLTKITASNIDQYLFSYDQYLIDESNPSTYTYQPTSNNGPGVFNRRVLSVPVGDCTGTANGSTTVPIMGFACFFLLQPVTQQGTTDYVIGEFEGNCQINGDPGPLPGAGPGPYVIELYHDPGSPDS